MAEEIAETKRIALSPLNLTWGEFPDRLIQLKFDELPTEDEIPNYYGTNEGYLNRGATYAFEYSNLTAYRFYQYNDLYRTNDRFWQPENVLEIRDFLDAEFQWETGAKEYFLE